MEISFSLARERVKNAIGNIVQEQEQQQAQSCRLKYAPQRRMQILFTLNFISLILFVIAAAIDHNFRVSFIFAASVILTLGLSNYVLLRRYYAVEKTEIITEMKSICEEYVTLLSQNIPDPNTNLGENSQGIIRGGHSHVSIIAAFRDGQWQRIPSLLLVEGDIISLMTGDTTPAAAYELISNRDNTSQVDKNRYSQPSTSTKKCGWRRGRLFEKGAKVLLRDERKKYSPQNDPIPQSEQDQYQDLEHGQVHDQDQDHERHNSEAEEVHIHPSEKMEDDSDMAGLLQHHHHHQHHQNQYQHQHQHDAGETSMRQESEKHKQSRAINSQSVELLTLSGDMRCFVMAETPIIDYCREVIQIKEKESVTNRDSFVRALFLHVMDEGFRLMFVILILFAVAIIIRVSLIHEANSTQMSLILLSPLAVILLSFSPISLIVGLFCAEALTTANLLATAEALINSENEADESTEDESLKRLTETHGLSFLSRHFESIYRTLFQGRSTRSSVSHERVHTRNENASEGSSVDSSSKQDEYQDEDIDDRVEKIADQASLSIPWGRQLTYTLRILSTRFHLPVCVSSCCGINSQTLLPTPLARSKLVEVLGAVTMVCFVDDDIVCEGYSVSEEVYLLNPAEKASINPEKAAGVVLDLHAIPQLTGSRFENPDWRKHLPSLKPIGLASMLTYASIGEDPGHSDSSTPKIPPHSGISSHDDDLISGSRRLTAETDLIRHVKMVPPLECLRELSEEIGFVEEDAEKYSRLLGVTVVAPRLGDIRLMEDTHAWGQEETRRRGNLTPHVTAVIVEEKRKGGLQLLSNGHPPLMLSYCREYWDGTNISPLTNEDRNQLWTVYERWDLEDFDVVAFGYTPVPVTVKSRILSKNERSVHRLVSKDWTKSKTSHNSDKIKRIGGKTLYFVDSCTERQLDGGHRRHGSAGSAGNGKLAEGVGGTGSEFTRDKNTLIQEPTSSADTTTNMSPGDGSHHPTESLPPAGEDATIKHDLIAPKPNRLKSYSPQLPLSPRDDYSIGDNSQILPDVSQQTDYGLEIRSEPNRSPMLIRDSDTNSDSDSVRSSTDIRVNKDSFRIQRARRGGSFRKLTSSLSQQITKHRTLIHGRGTEISQNIGHHRSTSDPSFFSHQTSRENKHRRELLEIPQSSEPFYQGGSDAPPRHSFRGFISPADSLDPHGYPLGSNSQSSRGFTTSDTIDSNDLILSPNIRTSHSLLGMESHPPFMKKSLSLDDGLNNYTDNPSPTDSAKDLSITLSPPQPHHTITSKSLVDDTYRDAEADTPTKRRIDPLNRKGSIGMNSKSLSETTWTILKQQVFLGMTASSVPIRRVIPTLVEDLTQAGIRFVYFSPRNMRRSKKLAEKIGLQTDWNCAISLRPLDSPDTHDPHRFISSYADWDVKARLPHGIEAIRQHLIQVDNVPLLVSLFTDSTPSTIKSMIEIFRENGEVVLSIGSAYRSYNQAIYQASDMGIAINMLPGDTQNLSSISSDVISSFPLFSNKSLCQPDLILMFRLVSLHTSHLLQSPVETSTVKGPRDADDVSQLQLDETYENIGDDYENDPQMETKPPCCQFVPSFDVLNCTGCFRRSRPSKEEKEDSTSGPTPLNLKGLLEAIRKGRVFLLNAFQIIALLAISCLSLSLWCVVSEAIPMSVPPVPPLPFVILFLCFQLPLISFSLLFTPSVTKGHIMRQTPRKNKLIRRPKDVSRFRWYLFARVSSVVFSVFIVGWFASSSRLANRDSDRWTDRITSLRDVLEDGKFEQPSLSQFWHVQDVMSAQFFLAVVTQSVTLLHRGQTITQLSTPKSHPEFFVAVFISFLVHVGILYLRAQQRDLGLHLYSEMDPEVWIAMGVCPLGGILVGLAVNLDDNFSYQRHLQFLRLEFDTRLGMHSPR